MGFLFILGSPGHSWASRDHFFGIQNQTFFDEESKVEPKRSLVVPEMDFGTTLGEFWRDLEVMRRILAKCITKPS